MNESPGLRVKSVTFLHKKFRIERKGYTWHVNLGGGFCAGPFESCELAAHWLRRSGCLA